MPIDMGVLKKLDRPSLSNEILKSTGSTNYTWEAYGGDIQLDALNKFIVLEGTTKLAQAMFKILLTPIGSIIEDSEYGTELSASVGQKLDSERFADIQTSVVDALIHHNLINQDNPNSDEVIETIDDIRVVQDIDEPRAMKVQVTVTTESGKSVVLQVPQVV
jgi:hypothetical protein